MRPAIRRDVSFLGFFFFIPTKGGLDMAKAPLGSGRRFASLREKLAAKGARNPSALSAWIGRKKLGSHRMAELSAIGRWRAAQKRRKAARTQDEGDMMMDAEDEAAMMEATPAKKRRKKMVKRSRRMASRMMD